MIILAYALFTLCAMLLSSAALVSARSQASSLLAQHAQMQTARNLAIAGLLAGAGGFGAYSSSQQTPSESPASMPTAGSYTLRAKAEGFSSPVNFLLGVDRFANRSNEVKPEDARTSTYEMTFDKPEPVVIHILGKGRVKQWLIDGTPASPGDVYENNLTVNVDRDMTITAVGDGGSTTIAGESGSTTRSGGGQSATTGAPGSGRDTTMQLAEPKPGEFQLSLPKWRAKNGVEWVLRYGVRYEAMLGGWPYDPSMNGSNQPDAYYVSVVGIDPQIQGRSRIVVFKKCEPGQVVSISDAELTDANITLSSEGRDWIDWVQANWQTIGLREKPKLPANYGATTSGGQPEMESNFPGEHFPVTRLRVLTRKEVASWEYKSVRYAINEIFARHGATFTTDYIQREFESKSWYVAIAGRNPTNMDGVLTAVERANITVLGERRDLLKQQGAR